MAWQSALEQARSVRLGRNTVIGLAAGVLVGLTLGLLIGWVWWPVEWQGPQTAAAPAAVTSSELASPALQAQYLGAVADAFAFGSAAGDATAAAVAAQRLAALGGDLRAAFGNAIAYYNGQGGDAARINNLTTLALAVGVPLDGTATDASVEQPVPGAAPAAAAGSAESGATSENAGSTNWFVTLLMAALLIGGGVYIFLWTMRQRQRPAETDAGAFVEEDLGATNAPLTPAFEREALTPMRPALTPAASIRSSVERPYASQEGGMHGFDSEETDIDDSGIDDSGIYDSGIYNEDEYAAGEEQKAVFERDARYRAIAAGNLDDDTLEAEEDVGEWEEDEEPADTPERPIPPAGFVTSVGAAPPFTGTRKSLPANDGPPSTPASTPGRTTPAVALQPPTPSRFERYTPVESYTATYYVGRVDFDYAKSLPTPEGVGYIGEYGIGIPDKRGYVNNDMEKAIAIDVYLFDKTDERQPSTISRTLMSLYADDHKRPELDRDRDATILPPIVAQPNTNFQLEGRVLLLDCQIKQVEYTSEGFFRNVTIELILKRKN